MSAKCWSELADALRISFSVMTTHPQIGKRTKAKAKNSYASGSKKPVACAWPAKILALCPITCGRIYGHLALLDLRFRNGTRRMA